MDTSLSLTQSQTSQTSFDLDQYQFSDHTNEHSKPILVSESKQSVYSESDFHFTDNFSEDDDDMPLSELLLSIQKTDTDILLATNGYKNLGKISDILQGELYKAAVTKSSLPGINKGTLVTIKRTDKELIKNGIVIQDGITCFIDKNAIKEVLILQQLTLLSHNNNTIGSHIIKFIDIFESDSHLYLVMEYIENGITLKQFVKEAHQLIREQKLLWKEYSKTIKYVTWQLISVISWLHGDVQCCHLDVCLDSIILQNAQFIKQSDESYKLSNEIQMKLMDFGFAELCSLSKGDENETKEAFEFVKHRLNIENEYLVSPEIYKQEVYDCREADMWSFGMILYQCMVGLPLYTPEDMFDEPRNGYRAVLNDQLKQYWKFNNVINCQLKYFDGSVSLLTHLLIMDPKKRFNATQVMKHKYFQKYYETFQKGLKLFSSRPKV